MEYLRDALFEKTQVPPTPPSKLEVLINYRDRYSEVRSKLVQFICQARVKAIKNEMAVFFWRLSSLMPNIPLVDGSIIQALEALFVET